MRLPRRTLAASLALVLALGGGAACGDDEGEDEMGDEEINDGGD